MSSLAAGFSSQSDYVPPETRRLLPFNFRRIRDRVFLSNDVGDYSLLSEPEFAALCDNPERLGLDRKAELYGKGFIAYPESLDLSLQLLSTRLRSRYSRLEELTALHLFVVTLRCDHSCHYCQVSRVSEDKVAFDMSPETASKAIRLMFQSPSRGLKVEFQGGEPLLNYPLIRSIIEECEILNAVEHRSIEYVVTTNLANLSAEHLAFFANHRVSLSTSLDGPQELHDANRPRKGNNSYELFRKNLDAARAALGFDRVAALMTTAERSLAYPEQIVQEYLDLGFEYVFIRPLSPYGFATRGRKGKHPQSKQFQEFYSRALGAVIDANRGGAKIVEGWAQILLQKVVGKRLGGFVDLVSPSGAGIMALLYNYNGKVYPADEGRMLFEMGDDSLCMGTVDSSLQDLFSSEAFQMIMRGGVNQSLPECVSCAFQPFCGADPMSHYATTGDSVGLRPTSDFCSKMIFSLELLLDLMENGDEHTRTVLTSWGTSQ